MKTKAADKLRLLVFVNAYNVENNIVEILEKIPLTLVDEFDVEILIIDDNSKDNTFEKTDTFVKKNKCWPNIKLLSNVEQQGHGGNQKLAFQYAIKNEYDFVFVSSSQCYCKSDDIQNLTSYLVDRKADVVLGNWTLSVQGTNKSGVPVHKFLINKLLTYFQNVLLGRRFKSFDSCCRLFNVRALKGIPFYLNSNKDIFDTEIMIQLVLSGKKIKETLVDSSCKEQIYKGKGIKCNLQGLRSSVKVKLQSFNLVYDRKFDCLANKENYLPKFNYISPHLLAIESVKKETFVLDIGCASGYVAKRLHKEKACRVFGLDMEGLSDKGFLEGFIKCNLDEGLPERSPKDVDAILMLDVLEHLSEPEIFLEGLREHFKYNPDTRIFASTGNIAFFINRFLHLFGIFNYGKKGILDLTHKRLFTRKTFVALFEQNGFEVVDIKPVPVPWQLVVGANIVGKAMNTVNYWLCRVWPTMFAYQFFLTVKINPHLDMLIKNAEEASKLRIKN